MNELEQKLDEILDAQEPAAMLQALRNNLERLRQSRAPKIEPSVWRKGEKLIRRKLDTAAAMMERSPEKIERIDRHMSEAWQAMLGLERLPDYVTGRVIVTAAKDGHIVVHGTDEEKRERWGQYQSAVNQTHANNPALSWSRIQALVAKQFGVSAKTIYRNCKNPKS